MTPAAGRPAPAAAGRSTWTVRACGNDPLAPSAPGAGTEGAANYPAGGARSTRRQRPLPARRPDELDAPARGRGPARRGQLPVRACRRPAGGRLRRRRLPRAPRAAPRRVRPGPAHRPRDHRPGRATRARSASSGSCSGPAPCVTISGPTATPRSSRCGPSPPAIPKTLAPLGPIETLAPDAPPRPIAAGQPLWLEPARRDGRALPHAGHRSLHRPGPARARWPAETLRFTFYATAGRFVPPETPASSLRRPPRPSGCPSNPVPAARRRRLPLDPAAVGASRR